MSYPYRCSNCTTRQSLKRRIEKYIVRPRCRVCRKDKLYLDRYRLRVERKVKPCLCDGWWFPHRKGSLGCNHHKETLERIDMEHWNSIVQALGDKVETIYGSKDPPF